MVMNGDDARMVLVEVTGLRWQRGPSTRLATFKVPYRSLARTLQFVKQRSGQIVRVEVMTPLPSLPSPSSTIARSEATRPEAIASLPEVPPTVNLVPSLLSEMAEKAIDACQPPTTLDPISQEALPTPAWWLLVLRKLGALFRHDSGG